MADSEDMNDLRARLNEYIDDVWMGSINMEVDDNGADYSQHETLGTEDSEWDYTIDITRLMHRLVEEHGTEEDRQRLLDQ